MAQKDVHGSMYTPGVLRNGQLLFLHFPGRHGSVYCRVDQITRIVQMEKGDSAVYQLDGHFEIVSLKADDVMDRLSSEWQEA